MKVVAFDAKDFNRSKVEEIRDPDQPEITFKKLRGFFSPLGAGVYFKHDEIFSQEYVQINQKLKKDFKIDNALRFFSSNQLKREIGLSKAIAYANQLIKEIEDFIEMIHISYVVLPPKDVPEVQVGGNRCPIQRQRSEEFVRSLSPSFSYISAWNFIRKRDPDELAILLDGFRSKNTIAWDELSSWCKPTVFSHGDECNPFISLADIVAFLTDVRLYQRKPGPTEDPMLYRGLRPGNVDEIWENAGFGVDCRFLDKNMLSKISWYSNDLIELSSILARPVVFFLVDQVEKIKIGEIKSSDTQARLDTEPTEEPRPFSKVVQRLDPYHAALIYAERKGGCLQFFDRYIDSDKVRDGDVMVYMGDNSKRIAQTYSDAYDIEIIKARDLRDKIKKMNDS